MNRLVASVLGLVLPCLMINAGLAVTLVDMDFDGVTGLENPGAGPEGVLVGTAAIGATAGVGGTGGLVMDGTADSGLRLDIGDLGAFSGTGDFSLSFDFKANTPGLASGMLFNTDPFTFIDDNGLEAPNDQEGALNVGLFGEEVGFDLWFFEGGGITGPFNDGNFHTVNFNYNASDKIFSVSSPSSPDVAEVFLDEAEIAFANAGRNTDNDLTWLGNNTNGDLVEDETGAPCNCTFDNLLIDGPSPPPVKLIVDRLTGDIDLEIIAGDPTSIDSIRIESNAGTLASASYTGLGATGGDFADWTVDSAGVFEISESGTVATVTNANGPFDLGSGVWTPFFDEDLAVIVNDTVLGEEVRGLTEFVNGSPALFADLDEDEDIDAADFGLLRDGFGSSLDGLSSFDAYFLADLNGDGTHNFEDWQLFAGAYDEFNGAGAFAALTSSVPEPATAGMLILAATSAVVMRRRKFVVAAMAAILLGMVGLEPAQAALEAEYLFDSDFSDTSGNGRTGIPRPDALFGPTVSGGKLNLTGGFEEAMEAPIPNDLLSGTSSFTIELDMNSTGNSFFPDAGVILASSANAASPSGDPEGSNQSMSIFVEPQADGGSLVIDYFFVGGVTVPDAMLLDGVDHSIIVSYEAPAELNDPESGDPNAGTFYLNVDGVWSGIGELDPRPAEVHDLVQFGTSANPDFPFECEEGSCFTSEFEGTMDNIRIKSGNDVVIPSLLRAEADRSTGELIIIGGEFARDVRYYEVSSDANAINSAAWNSLSDQNIDPIDDGADLGESWEELSGDSSQLAEAFLLGSSVFSDTENANVSLGNVYNSASGSEDLVVTVVTADGEAVDVPVEFVGNTPLFGDFDNDGDVDGADLTQWEGDYALNGDSDANNDGDSDGSDFLAWQRDFGNIVPAAGAASVPEPGCGVLLIASLLLASNLRRK